MAVSKIAVMALVGILAIPILLGYAFNLSEVAVTDYKQDGEAVNVTQMLQTASGYSYVWSDYYQMNTNFTDASHMPIMPNYNTKGSTQSALNLEQWNAAAGTIPPALNLFEFKLYYLSIIGTDNNNYMTLQLNMNVSGQYTFSNLKSISYVDSTKTVTVGYMVNNVYLNQTFDVTNDTSINTSYGTVGSFNGRFLQSWEWKNNPSSNWVNFSAGFRFFGSQTGYFINMPDMAKTGVVSVNLNSITDSSYTLNLNDIVLEKTTTGSNAEWRIYPGWDPSDVQILYYDPSINNNTYQFYFERETTFIGPEETSPGVYTDCYHYKEKTEARYIGAWQPQIGIANYYKTYTFEYDGSWNVVSGGEKGLQPLLVYFNGGASPTMRVDAALYRGMEYSIISDRLYNPAEFKTNPSTIISDIRQYGHAIEFAGNTYNIDSSGNITLGTHKVSVNGLKLESIPVSVGYENKINGNVISVSAQPSQIRFSGQWIASVSTVGNSATTYNTTQWTAGSFGWNGMDDNFLIVGLITCLGVFIGLGIYARKTGKGVIPLLIVCGGAAALFICMI